MAKHKTDSFFIHFFFLRFLYLPLLIMISYRVLIDPKTELPYQPLPKYIALKSTRRNHQLFLFKTSSVTLCLGISSFEEKIRPGKLILKQLILVHDAKFKSLRLALFMSCIIWHMFGTYFSQTLVSRTILNIYQKFKLISWKNTDGAQTVEQCEDQRKRIRRRPAVQLIDANRPKSLSQSRQTRSSMHLLHKFTGSTCFLETTDFRKKGCEISSSTKIAILIKIIVLVAA